MDRAQRRVILFRDITCITVGAVGFLQQTFMATEASPILVPATLGLLLGPAGFAVWAQRNSAGLPITERSPSDTPPSVASPSSQPPS